MNRKLPTTLSAFFLASSICIAAFSSGSDGSDGALLLDDPNNTILFDPVALGLDSDGDGIFHFTTITITAYTTVRCTAVEVDAPMVWLATGDVSINGTIDISGSHGKGYGEIANNAGAAPAVPGPGGFPGGTPGVFSDESSFMIPGGGPGGATAPEGTNSAAANSDYMSPYGIPLVGGSGGSGGGPIDMTGIHAGGGGGAGGGSILIASDTIISVLWPGTINANGGIGGYGYYYGGSGGSGGMIRLVAPEVSSNVAFSAAGGTRGGARETYARGENATGGVIRIESGTTPVGGNHSPPASFGSPYDAFVPDRDTHPWPKLYITEVGGVAIDKPKASFETSDAAIDTDAAVDVVITAQGIPNGTEITLNLFPENGSMSSHTANLSGDESSATATISVTLPAGYTRGFVTANWGS
ncbi:MAG: hypothetical protein AB3N63_17535 [Puniceicoccaceae bacterium]